MSITVEPTASATTPSDVQVRVFHNNSAPASFCGFEVNDSVTEVYSYTVLVTSAVSDEELAEELAEEAFRLFNVGHDPAFGEPDQRAVQYRAAGNRSLSIGDVVSVAERFHALTREGWFELAEVPVIAQRRSHGTTPAY
ncbi:hypothetical protein AB0A63_13820 [Lentzea sp. NPDC042327]|uniref:hypothetical protein n=1 Tax=Lentzea sp. NPDC042327 TaxID=3154801 RepID=UPI0033C4BADD